MFIIPDYIPDNVFQASSCIATGQEVIGSKTCFPNCALFLSITSKNLLCKRDFKVKQFCFAYREICHLALWMNLCFLRRGILSKLHTWQWIHMGKNVHVSFSIGSSEGAYACYLIQNSSQHNVVSS